MRGLRNFYLVLLIASFVIVSLGFAGADITSESEVYFTTATPTDGLSFSDSVQLQITIDSYTTEQEREHLLELLKDKGRKAMRNALEDMDHGTIAPTGQVGYRLNYVSQEKSANGKRIEIILARPLGFVELTSITRSRDYEFMIFNFEVGADGTGTGQLTPAARITFDEQEGFDVSPYNVQFWRLQGLRRLND